MELLVLKCKLFCIGKLWNLKLWDQYFVFQKHNIIYINIFTKSLRKKYRLLNYIFKTKNTKFCCEILSRFFKKFLTNILYTY